ncbi:MAG: hypothetical protein CEE38_23735 [Planctomycetes bacterium B3_Pla]|nr:MAG: hypothetical protein CEE38_23735 [Planctomycetes bacterium B3_Pla]
MKAERGNHFKMKGILAFLLTLVVLGSFSELQAQFVFKWMNIGRLAHAYSQGGITREEEPQGYGDQAYSFPSIEHNSGNQRAASLWIAATDFTDENGDLFPVKIAHHGPRTIGALQFFDQELIQVARFPQPEVYVNGARSFRRWSIVDEVDETIKADRMLYLKNNNRVGIDMEVNVHAFANEYHDNYHIIEYTFTNSGNVDGDPEIELDATLEGVYFFFIKRYGFHSGSAWITGNGAPWGKFCMNDAVGDGNDAYPLDFRSQYAWAGYYPDQTKFNTLGQSMWEELTGWLAGLATQGDTLGRLAVGHMMGRTYIHADKSTTDSADDVGQPYTMGYMNSDHKDLADDEYNHDLMGRQYNDWITAGRMYPHHADLVEPEGKFDFPTNDPSTVLGVSDEGGWAFIEGYGPYTMAIGASVNLVVAEGAAGLSDTAKVVIGRAYKKSGADDDLLIDWPADNPKASLTKNQWVLSSKDSLFQMFERARANYASGMDIPQPPKPPQIFNVTSSGEKVALTWETYAGEPDPVAWEVWRADPLFEFATKYELVKTLPGTARSYDDKVDDPNPPISGIEHFYYLQAVGPVNTDATGLTPTDVPLKSGRYYTQTYFPVSPGRLAGSTLADIRIVPNPFHLGADQDIRWPDRQDKLGFVDIPGKCTIRIYTQLGELVNVIEHTDGTGDEYWDHTTSSRQLVVSGLYIAVIQDNVTNEKAIRKFVIIR